MTVKELREQLANYPDEQRVVVSGYEGGYDNVKALSAQKIQANANWKDGDKMEWCFGRHSMGEDTDYTEIAVLIGG